MSDCMISDPTIYRAANRLIERHGDYALEEASQSVDRALALRDRDRMVTWLRIFRAIAALQAPPSGPLH